MIAAEVAGSASESSDEEEFMLFPRISSGHLEAEDSDEENDESEHELHQGRPQPRQDTLGATESRDLDVAVSLAVPLLPWPPLKEISAAERASTLREWGLEAGAKFFGVELRPSTCEGIGAFATTPISQGSIVISISRRMVITAAVCMDDIPALGSLQAATFSSLVLFLIHQRLQGSNARFSGFVETLPTEAPPRSALGCEMVGEGEDTNTNVEKDEKQKGHNAADVLLRALAEPYREACLRVRGRAAAATSYINDMLAPKLGPHQLQAFRDPEAQRWAMSMVFSRAFTVHGQTVLLPVVDALNNNTADGCELAYDDAGNLVLRAMRAYEAGDEVYLNYGNDKSDPEMLAAYGYCAEDAFRQEAAEGGGGGAERGGGGGGGGGERGGGHSEDSCRSRGADAKSSA